MRAPILVLALLAVAASRGGCDGDADEGARHPDCAGKACGESCNPCGPERICPTFAPTACSRSGDCVTDVPWLCHDPCAGKACGESCSACPPLPEGEGCFETAVVKECHADGRCDAAPAACGR